MDLKKFATFYLKASLKYKIDFLDICFVLWLKVIYRLLYINAGF